MGIKVVLHKTKWALFFLTIFSVLTSCGTSSSEIGSIPTPFDSILPSTSTLTAPMRVTDKKGELVYTPIDLKLKAENSNKLTPWDGKSRRELYEWDGTGDTSPTMYYRAWSGDDVIFRTFITVFSDDATAHRSFAYDSSSMHDLLSINVGEFTERSQGQYYINDEDYVSGSDEVFGWWYHRTPIPEPNLKNGRDEVTVMFRVGQAVGVCWLIDSHPDFDPYYGFSPRYELLLALHASLSYTISQLRSVNISGIVNVRNSA